MTYTHSWGGTANVQSWTEFVNNFVYKDGIAMPTGAQALGGNYPIVIQSVTGSVVSGNGMYAQVNYQGVVTGGPYGFANSGGTFRHMIGHSTGRMTFNRNSGGGGVIGDSAGSATQWAGTTIGTLQWYTVPSAPGSISAVRTGRNVRVTFTGPANDGGGGIAGYVIQYSTNGGASWGGDTASSGDTTFSNLTAAATYYFRVWAHNGAGYSLATTSGAVFIAAGGKRYNGTAWVSTATAKRYNGTAWVDFTTGKRYNGTSWIDFTS